MVKKAAVGRSKSPPLAVKKKQLLVVVHRRKQGRRGVIYRQEIR